MLRAEDSTGVSKVKRLSDYIESYNVENPQSTSTLEKAFQDNGILFSNENLVQSTSPATLQFINMEQGRTVPNTLSIPASEVSTIAIKPIM